MMTARWRGSTALAPARPFGDTDGNASGVPGEIGVTKRIEQLIRRAEGALGNAFRQLDAAGSIARKLELEAKKGAADQNFVDFMIIREVIERIGRICNAAFIADARASGPLPFPTGAGMLPGAWSGGARPVKARQRSPRSMRRKKGQS